MPVTIVAPTTVSWYLVKVLKGLAIFDPTYNQTIKFLPGHYLSLERKRQDKKIIHGNSNTRLG